MTGRDYPTRRSPRAPAFDYATPGWYFITIVTHRRALLFGDVTGNAMALNSPGQMVATRWEELPSRFPAVEIGDYVVMPNHLHALIQLRPDMPTGDALTRIVGAFKSLTTNDYVAGVNELGWPRFDGHVWQRSFYDRVVRDGDELARISEYIEANPRLWAEDEENPARGSS